MNLLLEIRVEKLELLQPEGVLFGLDGSGFELFANIFEFLIQLHNSGMLSTIW